MCITWKRASWRRDRRPDARVGPTRTVLYNIVRSGADAREGDHDSGMSDRGFLFLFSILMILGGLATAGWLLPRARRPRWTGFSCPDRAADCAVFCSLPDLHDSPRDGGCARPAARRAAQSCPAAPAASRLRPRLPLHRLDSRSIVTRISFTGVTGFSVVARGRARSCRPRPAPPPPDRKSCTCRSTASPRSP